MDPHDQQAIADALLKLVADKHLWARCRLNGLKNIHLFSWPEHCRTYLSRIVSCRPRHPQWKRSDEENENSESDSPSDSLRGIQDISLDLKLSLDGEKGEESDTTDNVEDLGNGIGDGKSKLENAVLSVSKGVLRHGDQGSVSNKFPLRRRKHIFVIAVDSDSNEDLLEVIQNIFDATCTDRVSGSIGFILSTALTISEIHSLLVTGGLTVFDFDAFICNSGSEVYYPSSNSDVMLVDSKLPFVVDEDYHSQIEYRWGAESLRSTLVRWAASIVDKERENEQIVREDEERSTGYCYAFEVKNPGLVILHLLY